MNHRRKTNDSFTDPIDRNNTVANRSNGGVNRSSGTTPPTPPAQPEANNNGKPVIMGGKSLKTGGKAITPPHPKLQTEAKVSMWEAQVSKRVSLFSIHYFYAFAIT
jgi:hypothetical protein